MTEKFEGTTPPQESKDDLVKIIKDKLKSYGIESNKNENEQIDKLVEEILQNDRLTINKSIKSNESDALREFMDSISKEQVINAIREKADFRTFDKSFVTRVAADGHVTESSSAKDSRSIGTTIPDFISIASVEDENRRYTVTANLDLLMLDSEEPKIVATLYTFNYERDIHD